MNESIVFFSEAFLKGFAIGTILFLFYWIIGMGLGALKRDVYKD